MNNRLRMKIRASKLSFSSIVVFTENSVKFISPEEVECFSSLPELPKDRVKEFKKFLSTIPDEKIAEVLEKMIDN